MLTRPPSGWSSLVLLMAMLSVVGLAVIDARPLALGSRGTTALPLVALVAAGLVGYLVARSGIGVVRAHFVGAGAGAVILLLAASTSLGRGSRQMSELTDPALLHQQLMRLSTVVETEVHRLVGSSAEPPAILAGLVLAAICWSIGQFSAFGVFRYRRGGPAIVACGTLLLLNEALPPLVASADHLPLLWALAAFSLLAVMLQVRLQLTTHAWQWARRQITPSPEVDGRFLRWGGVFALLAVLAASSLTVVARVPAQDVDTAVLDGPLDGLRGELSRWLRLVAVDVTSGEATTLEDRLQVADEWAPGGGEAFAADVQGDLRGNYWWLSAFSDFDGHAWSRAETTTDEVPAEAPLGVPADASGAGPYEVAVTVTPRRSALALGTLIGPSEAITVSRDVRVRSLGDREGLTEVTFADELLRGASYTVHSAVHDYETGEGSLTASILRAAGSDYPAWIDRYLRVDAGASGPRTARLAAEIELLAKRTGHDSAYDRARLLQDRLRTMDYRTSVEGLCQAGENVPECLLRTEIGFCQQFASTMVMALRELEVPARLVSGYLPGEPREDGRWDVPQQAMHAWVEVYFPGIGWLRFDPTPGDQLRRFAQLPTSFAEGEPVATPDPAASLRPANASPPGEAGAEATASPPAMAAVGSGDDDGAVMSLWLLALGLAGLAILLVATVLVVRLRRLPEADGGLAYGRIAGLATRLGHGPHPAQTEFEYVASLSDALPSVKPELYLVAQARVEQRYGRRGVALEGRAALQRAYARIRTALLRLGWRSRH